MPPKRTPTPTSTRRAGREIELVAAPVALYLEALVPKRHSELARMERAARKTHFPIIGPAVGQLCYLLARAIGARRVFELGSGFGYSTAWFARAVRESGGGVVHHVVWDEDLSTKAKGHLAAMGLDDVVRYTVGEAVDVLKKTEGIFDVMFCDIDKHGYPAALPIMEGKLRSGGLLIVDNMLWSGRIFDASDKSKDTEGIRKFTRLVFKSPQWAASIVPIRDGVLVARKI